MLSIILFFIGFIGTSLIIPLFKNLLVSSNLVRPNYKGENIPVSMGIVFLPMLILNSILLIYLTDENIIYTYMFLFGIMSMFLAGALDDIIGNRDVSGLKGHFKSLFKGKLTTGGFKALFGGFVGVLISISISKNIIDIIINTLIIALSTNFMNLLDLRPGRAIKVRVPEGRASADEVWADAAWAEQASVHGYVRESDPAASRSLHRSLSRTGSA